VGAQPQAPAPNADPKPSGSARQRYYVRWYMRQDFMVGRYFSYSFRSTNGEVIIAPEPPEMVYGLEFSRELEVIDPGIARISVLKQENARSDSRVLCQIHQRRGRDAEWILVAEDEGWSGCETFAPIMF
jgi:hypothetical protein